MCIKGGIDSPEGPANAIPLSKTVWRCRTTICSQSHALGTGFVSPVFFPGINFIWLFFLGATLSARAHTYV